MPSQLQTWFLGTLGAPGKTWDGAVIYQDVFRVVQGPALLITGVAAGGRVLRATLDHRLAAAHVVFDTLPRLLVAVALIGIPGTHASLGYVVIAFAVDASVAVAQVLFSLLLQAPLLAGPQAVEGWLDQIIGLLLSNAPGSALVAAALIPLIVLVLYAFALMVVRTVMLAFCIATAPLCLATAVFDTNNRFFRWWMDLFIGVLTAPAVLGIAIALSLTLAVNLAPLVPPLGALLAVIVMCGGLWMGAKMVHTLTWRHFGHGGAIAGFTAGISTMLGPLHKFAEVGSLANTFSSSRSGGEGTSGRTPMTSSAWASGFVGGGAASASGGALIGHSLGDAVMATGGPPDIASALGSSSRSAVLGAEARFSQRAFTAFSRTQSGLIGSLTRDLPAGAIATADRAKMAWARVPSRTRNEFAEEFLSHWLGSPDGDSATFAGSIEPLTAPAGSAA